MNQKEMEVRLDKGEDPLELSIEKWEDVIKQGPNAEQGDLNCALCKVYFPSGCKKPCKGCPVFKETRAKFCHGTPYMKYCVARDKETPLLSELNEIAKKEVEFLKSLRKK